MAQVDLSRKRFVYGYVYSLDIFINGLLLNYLFIILKGDGQRHSKDMYVSTSQTSSERKMEMVASKQSSAEMAPRGREAKHRLVPRTSV